MTKIVREIMRTTKYFWIKKSNLLIGLFFTIPFPFITFAWMSGKLAIEGENVDPLLQAWSNPGALSGPIFITAVMFIVGLLTLLYVILRCDIDDILPESNHD